MAKVNLDKVLNMVNKLRAAMGKKPLKNLPKGDLNESDSCPLARALGCSISDDVMVMSINKATQMNKVLKRGVVPFLDDPKNVQIETPKTFVNFIYEFDEEQFPKLIRKN